jgi:hypothetical protein
MVVLLTFRQYKVQMVMMNRYLFEPRATSSTLAACGAASDSFLGACGAVSDSFLGAEGGCPRSLTFAPAGTDEGWPAIELPEGDAPPPDG